jgi:hypothetical protein
MVSIRVDQKWNHGAKAITAMTGKFRPKAALAARQQSVAILKIYGRYRLWIIIAKGMTIMVNTTFEVALGIHSLIFEVSHRMLRLLSEIFGRGRPGIFQSA